VVSLSLPGEECNLDNIVFTSSTDWKIWFIDLIEGKVINGQTQIEGNGKIKGI